VCTHLSYGAHKRWVHRVQSLLKVNFNHPGTPSSPGTNSCVCLVVRENDTDARQLQIQSGSHVGQLQHHTAVSKPCTSRGTHRRSKCVLSLFHFHTTALLGGSADPARVAWMNLSQPVAPYWALCILVPFTHASCSAADVKVMFANLVNVLEECERNAQIAVQCWSRTVHK
jgi:hypothetical protein